jgi:hypothetical protein
MAGANRLNRAWLSLFLALVAALLGSLFYARIYHDLYCLSPAVFILSTTIGAASASAGGFLLGKHLVVGREGGVGALYRLSIGLGTVVALVGSMLGVVAIGLAIRISTTGCWGSAPDDYSFN